MIEKPDAALAKQVLFNQSAAVSYGSNCGLAFADQSKEP